MTATIVPRRRSWVPALNLVLASAALVTAVIALATDGDSAGVDVTPTPTVAAVVHEAPADPAVIYRRTIDGCDRTIGLHPC